MRRNMSRPLRYPTNDYNDAIFNEDMSRIIVFID